MTCLKPTDCAPCSDCEEPIQPVLPRCQDVVINDGTYVNATVTVENGCITLIESGIPMLYQPDACCSPVAGGGGGDGGLDGDNGVPGEAATVQIGTVASTAPGTAPTVVNVGTPTHAIFNITIPRGEPGADAELPVAGIEYVGAGYEIEDGLIKQLPASWPPITDALVVASDVAGANMTFEKDAATGLLKITMDFSDFELALKTYTDDAIAGLQTQITALQSDLVAAQAQIATCCPP